MTRLTGLPCPLVRRGSRGGAAHRKRSATQRAVKATRPAVARGIKRVIVSDLWYNNCQLATVAQGQVVVGLDMDTTGSDRGRQRDMLGQIEKRYERRPKRLLIDGGFTKNDDTEWAAGRGVKLYGPPARNKHGTDPSAPRPGDKPGVAAWRRRMKSPHGKSVYRRRAPGECINARFRQWGLHRFTVRGCDKAATVLRWFALANNILQTHRLTSPTPA